MSEITRTAVAINEVRTPLLKASEAQIGTVSFNNISSFQAQEAYIENLTIKKVTVLEEEVSATSEETETYENVEFGNITLKFRDEDNCKYLIADDSSLVSEIDYKSLLINFEVPVELGSKLVCRYLVLDLRNIEEDIVISTTWPNTSALRWLHGVPDIQAGYFYVLSFQRFAKDLIVGNVSVKLAA